MIPDETSVRVTFLDATEFYELGSVDYDDSVIVVTAKGCVTVIPWSAVQKIEYHR